MKGFAIIGGTGLEEMPGAEIVEEIFEENPFGLPSAPVKRVKISDEEVLFLARHGEEHTILPSEINYRANIYALKKLGAKRVVSVAAVGSLRENIKPGDFVIVDQFFDRTRGREDTFFGEGVVAHVSFGEPICPELHKNLLDAAKTAAVSFHGSGIYVNIEGPAFSTRAEANFYRNVLQADVVGMTNMTEAKLAREAGICYATLAHVTDYDCWRDKEKEVTVTEILKLLNKNAESAKKILTLLIKKDFECGKICGCAETIDSALITRRENISKENLRRLKEIL